MIVLVALRVELGDDDVEQEAGDEQAPGER